MQSAVPLNQPDSKTRDLLAALPLYAASLVVTLTGIGGVGVTITSTTWLPLWALLAVLGHGVSLVLRYARVSAETVFYPVMLLLGYLTGALFLGDRVATWIAKRRGVVVKPGWRYIALALALVALLLVSKVPFAGIVVLFLVLLVGLGAFWLRAYRGYAKKPMPPADTQIGLDLV